MFTPECLVEKTNDNFPTGKYKSLKQIARKKSRNIAEELIKGGNKSYYFTERILKIAIKNSLDNHHNNHAKSLVTFRPNYVEIEKVYVKMIVRKMLDIYLGPLGHFF